MTVCPSAKEGVDISAVITEFCENSFYEDDYQSITSYFTEDFVSYEDTIKNMRKIKLYETFLFRNRRGTIRIP